MVGILGSKEQYTRAANIATRAAGPKEAAEELRRGIGREYRPDVAEALPKP